MSTNLLGLSRKDYIGLKSTLCTGCGHDSVTNHLITAIFESNISPHKIAKLSGIGCSSKTTAYFLNQSHGFNSIHGRMAPIATGVHMANHELTLIGISGDGDSMSIGLSGLAHLIRRNVPMVYIIENNGVYGLTKGQFSATADLGSKLKGGSSNDLSAIDACQFALTTGATFVARSFSGDKKQLVPILKAAIQHRGTAIIDIISPCVTFNNHEGSTKSFESVKERNHVLQELGYIEPQQQIEAEAIDGEVVRIKLHDGSQLQVKKIDENSHDIRDRKAAINMILSEEDVLNTGVFYIDENSKSFHQSLGQIPSPLHQSIGTNFSSEQLNALQKEFE